MNNIRCPAGFILFDNLCYYISRSFVNNIRTGEQVCFDKYENSTLVKFDSHQWGNTKTTRFLGRALDDILLELFYYQLEKKLIIETKTNKHWLRLLLGNNNDENGCVLRYFNRSTGTFTISPHCDQGGNPVCQSQPILIDEIITNPSKTDNKLLIKIIIVSLVALIILINTIFLVYYHRRGDGSYLARYLNRRSNPERKDLPKPANPNETSNTPTVLYSRSQRSSISTPMDGYMSNSFDDLVINDDQIYLLPQSSHLSNLYEKIEAENDEGDPCYATLEPPNDK